MVHPGRLAIGQTAGDGQATFGFQALSSPLGLFTHTQAWRSKWFGMPGS